MTEENLSIPAEPKSEARSFEQLRNGAEIT